MCRLGPLSTGASYTVLCVLDTEMSSAGTDAGCIVQYVV